MGADKNIGVDTAMWEVAEVWQHDSACAHQPYSFHCRSAVLYLTLHCAALVLCATDAGVELDVHPGKFEC